MSRKTVLVDVDGTLAKYDGWHGLGVIGDPIDGAVEFTHVLAKQYSVVIFTTRAHEKSNRKAASEMLKEKYPRLEDTKENRTLLIRGLLEDWLDRHGFAYDDIEGKPSCVAIVDDRAVPCVPLKHGVTEYVEAFERVESLA